MPKCPYCGGSQWLGGPSGGVSQNILCANTACRHWFNYAPGMMFDDLNRVEPTPEERLRVRQQQLATENEGVRRRYQEGVDAFERGAFSISLTRDSCSIDRICGFIDAMAEKVRGSDVEERVGALEHPHRCPVCDCDFSSADAQRQHMLARHGG